MEKKIKKHCPMSYNDGAITCDDGLNCQWWVTLYTTEYHRVQMCAIEAIALKNSDGKIPV